MCSCTPTGLQRENQGGKPAPRPSGQPWQALQLCINTSLCFSWHPVPVTEARLQCLSAKPLGCHSHQDLHKAQHHTSRQLLFRALLLGAGERGGFKSIVSLSLGRQYEQESGALCAFSSHHRQRYMLEHSAQAALGTGPPLVWFLSLSPSPLHTFSPPK